MRPLPRRLVPKAVMLPEQVVVERPAVQVPLPALDVVQAPQLRWTPKTGQVVKLQPGS